MSYPKIVKSNILLEEHPSKVRIYEEPEIGDMIPWFIIIFFFFILMIGFWSLTSSEQMIIPILVIVVILLPFFINRFIIKKGSVGGESFKMIRYADDTIEYRSKIYNVEDIHLELITRELRYNTINLLYLVTSEDGETKLRTDYNDDLNKSITHNLAQYLGDHLGIEIQRIQDSV